MAISTTCAISQLVDVAHGEDALAAPLRSGARDGDADESSMTPAWCARRTPQRPSRPLAAAGASGSLVEPAVACAGKAVVATRRRPRRVRVRRASTQITPAAAAAAGSRRRSSGRSDARSQRATDPRGWWRRAVRRMPASISSGEPLTRARTTGLASPSPRVASHFSAYAFLPLAGGCSGRSLPHSRGEAPPD